MERAALDAELAELNAAVEQAIAARTAWMDAHMVDYARYQVGETIYDLTTGTKLGEVTRLYRYWAPDSGHGDNPRLDTSMSINYEYRTGRNSYDNTSRQPGLLIGNHEELARRRERELKSLRR